ncbi:hypothetical protein Cgig2_034049 [Carnegiea gigantea]|uniref:Uncharacterized protein n=1 Tax=Carnegiea gigantea TaxID=171969 RepID=A0A9Q1KJT5_9CARY|nr:hypothetical protein Cgig2_034049 [Carnegiea gigantea]
MEATNSARPLPYFDYVPTTCCEPFYRRIPIALHHHSDEVREAARPDRIDRSQGENHDQSIGVDTLQRAASEVNHGLNAICNAFLMYCLVRGAGTNLEAPGETSGQRRARAPNAEKATADDLSTVTTQCAEIFGHTNVKCRELRKALHELADKGQINCFLKR